MLSLLEGAPPSDFRLHLESELRKNVVMDAFKLTLVSLAGWMNRQQQHVIEYLQEEIRVVRSIKSECLERMVLISSMAWRISAAVSSSRDLARRMPPDGQCAAIVYAQLEGFEETMLGLGLDIDAHR